ncbi:amidase signature domain-containing protein [Nemania diffusa]|nr:amidase signature domain-containing protein [Nemania diffusa]
MTCHKYGGAGAADLKHLLRNGQLTSITLVEQCLAQIQRHEPTLNALAFIAPRNSVLRIEYELNDERQRGCVRSSLHGIPVVLNLGIKTCARAVAFADAKASRNAAAVQKMIDAGVIVIAKGNMTLAGMKTVTMMPGWSAYRDQTVSLHVGGTKKNEQLLGHLAPGGLSTGPAVSVVTGFTPPAMGAETIGSIITPSVCMALYALKPTIGTQDASRIGRWRKGCASSFQERPSKW